MILYEYVRGWGSQGKGRGVMTQWRRVLEREGRDSASLALLDQALDRLEQASVEDLPRLIAGTLPSHPEIRKLQLGGGVRLRPLLCSGPFDKREELTFLMPAFERNWKFDPKDAVKQASKRREALLDGTGRRIPYERD